MLTKFSVSNFKCFNNQFLFDLSTAKNYTFNPGCVKNGIVNNAMIYGYNGIGKSNLGWAIFDVIEHLTDKNRIDTPYHNYLNAYNLNDVAEFDYEFNFNGDTVRYKYLKKDYKTIAAEWFWINNQELISIDRRNGDSTFTCLLNGTEMLNKVVPDDQLSILKYVKNNSVLDDSRENLAFKKFYHFIDHMLFFRSLEDRTYIGQEFKKNSLINDIINSNKVEDFERFLNTANVKCKLAVVEDNGDKKLVFDFGNKKILFHEIMSTGTSSLMLFYCWFLQILKGEVSFVFIDEFDAFYHHELSRMIINKLKESGVQFVVTTHNTSIMSNDLLRPDCYYLMYNDKVLPLSKCTNKELREAHNIEKIYKSGAFYVEQ